MNSNKTYDPKLNDKFSELSFPDMETTWSDMRGILDKEMPQEKKRRGLFWFNNRISILSLLLAISAVTLILCICINSPQNSLLKESSSTTRDENNNIQFAYPTGTEESLAGNKIRKEGDYMLPGQNTLEPIPINNLLFPGWPYINSVRLNPAADFEAGEPGIIAKNIFGGSRQSTYEPLYTVNPFQLPGVKAGKDKSAKQDIRLTTATSTSGRINISLSYDASVAPGNKQGAANNITPSKTAALQKGREVGLAKEKIKIADVKMKSESSLTSDPLIGSAVVAKPKLLTKSKGWVVGGSVNYNLPVSQQEMSTVNVNGKKNTLIDFLPSLYVQYHFNKKWYAETEFQFSSPQYTSNHKLAAGYKDIDPNKKEENAVWLNKLYYLNIPVSIHFRVLPNLTIGAGIQYSHLRRSIFTDEIALWEKGPNGWEKTASKKNVAIKSNNGKAKSTGNGNGNGGGSGGGGGGGGTTPTAALTQVDTVAQSLRSSDWRALFDVNYNWKRFNVGIRYNFGLDNYINTKSGNTVLPVKDRNQAVQLYLRYNIFDKRKKK